MEPYYNNNYGGYPFGYPPQQYGYNNSMNNPVIGTGTGTNELVSSPFSPFMNIPKMPDLPKSQLEEVYISPDGVLHGASGEGPLEYISLERQLNMIGYQNPQPQFQQPYMNPYMNQNYGNMNTNPMNYGYQNPQPQFQQQMTQNTECANPYLQHLQNNNYQPVQQQTVQTGSTNEYVPYSNMQTQPHIQQQSGYYPPQPNGYGYYPNQQPGYNIGGYGYNGYGYQTTFDYQYSLVVAAEEYGHHLPGFDPFDCLRDVILTDEEKKLSQINTPVGYYYNGSPIYSHEQQMEHNKIYEETRENVINFWTQLSIAAHRGTGETNVDEQEIRSHFDQRMWEPAHRPITTLTPDELEMQNQYTRVYQTQTIHNMFNKMEYYYDYLDQKRAEGYAKIKASHDKILGVKEEDMNLRTYLSNAGSLYVDTITRDYRKMQHDGTIRYARSGYKNMMAKPGAGQMNRALIDEDYVPLEKRLKEQYVMSKLKPKTIRLNENGEMTILPPPKRPDPSTDEHRAMFLQNAMREYTPHD